MLQDSATTLPSITLICAVAIVVGLVGIILPVLPGTLLILGSVLLWAVVAQDPMGWWLLAFAAILAACGWGLQYLIPGRRLRVAGVPNRTLLVGGLLGIVGFFVVPVLGLVLGFVGGVFLAELSRHRDLAAAWPSTVHALKAAALSYGIELCAGLSIAAAFAFTAWRVHS